MDPKRAREKPSLTRLVNVKCIQFSLRKNINIPKHRQVNKDLRSRCSSLLCRRGGRDFRISEHIKTQTAHDHRAGLTGELQAGSAAEHGSQRVVGRALVLPHVLVAVQAADNKVSPGQAAPAIQTQIDEGPVQRPSARGGDDDTDHTVSTDRLLGENRWFGSNPKGDWILRHRLFYIFRSWQIIAKVEDWRSRKKAPEEV